MIQKVAGLTSAKNNISFGATSKDLRTLIENSSMTPRNRNILLAVADQCDEFGRELSEPLSLKLGQPNQLPPEVASKKARGITLEVFDTRLNTERLPYQKPLKPTSYDEYFTQGHVINKILKDCGVKNPDVIEIGGK